MANTQPEFQEPIPRILNLVLGDFYPPSEIIQELDLLRAKQMAKLIFIRLTSVRDMRLKLKIMELLESLPECVIGRLLRSPAMCEYLRVFRNWSAIHQLLNVEKAIYSEAPHVLTGWSALGDAWLGTSPPPSPVILRKLDSVFRGPSLTCGIPIDLSLPERINRPSAGLVHPRWLHDNEFEEALREINEAVDVLKWVTPIGHRSLLTLTSNIVLRVDTGRNSEAWGATSGAAIGRIVVVNPNLSTNPYHLAELLLHETMHTALDCAELVSPMLPDERANYVKVKSPWTGRELYLHAFIHAAVVWSAILKFWESVISHAPQIEGAQERYSQVLDGFKSANVETYCQTLSNYSAPTAARVVNAAWQVTDGMSSA